MRHDLTALSTLAALILSATATLADEPPSGVEIRTGKVIAVVGSSVAYGYLSRYESPMDCRNGYAHRLARLLRPRGWVTRTKLSMPGDTTERVLQRIDEDVFPIADYAIIGLSLENEGIRMGGPEKVYRQFERGLRTIIEQCRAHNVVPIIGLCYPNDNFAEQHYQFVKDMNLLINSWDVPSVNFLGAVDDGSGHWPPAYRIDKDHPNNKGYEEMFYAIVPSLFDALKAGKPIPRKPEGDGFVTIAAGDRATPLSFTPTDTTHSFSIAFEVHPSSEGTIAAITAGRSTPSIEIGKNAKLRYLSSRGNPVEASNKVLDDNWHHVVLSHRHAKRETLFFVDGELAGTVGEQLAPSRFVLGGPGDKKKNTAPQAADYRDWMVYRAALNTDEVKAMHKGRLLQASMEVYAPLRMETLPENRRVENRAQSTSQVLAYPLD